MSKAVTISLLIIFLQISIAITLWTGMFSTQRYYDQELLDTLENDAQGKYQEAQLASDTTYLPFADIFKSLSMFAKILGKTLFLPFLVIHQTFNINMSLSILLAMPVYAVHLIALIQFLRGVNLPQQR